MPSHAPERSRRFLAFSNGRLRSSRSVAKGSSTAKAIAFHDRRIRSSIFCLESGGDSSCKRHF